MHDCFGKPLKVFDTVRAATKEELAANGHQDSPDAFPGGKVIVAAQATSETCNVIAVDGVGSPVLLLAQDGQSGAATYPFRGSQSWLTARRLVKVEAA